MASFLSVMTLEQESYYKVTQEIPWTSVKNISFPPVIKVNPVASMETTFSAYCFNGTTTPETKGHFTL